MDRASPLESRARRLVPPALWERGESYARAGAVSVVSRGAEEERWRVAQPGVRAPVEVTVWVADGDWACTCEAEGCAHIAAVCAARLSGRFVVAAAPAEVRYHLRAQPEGLAFERDAPADAPRRPEDQELNRILAGWWGRPGVPKGLVAQALGALRGLPLDLDGVAVRADARPVLPRVIVEDEGRGWKVRLVRAAGIRDAFRNGALRITEAGAPDVIRPIGDIEVAPELRQRLLLGIVFAPAEVERLVTHFLPELRRLVEVEVRSASLPQARALPPRLEWEVVAREGRVRAIPRVVYGDPPFARVERGELIRLGGPIVVRDLAAERRLEATLSEESGLVPGMTVEREGAAAALWADGLKGTARETILRAAPGLRIDRRGVEVSVHVTEAGDAFAVTIDGGVSGEALVSAWNTGESLVPLLGGGWRLAPREWLERHGALLAEVLAARGSDGKVPRHAAPLLLDNLDALGATIPPGLHALRALAGDFSAVPGVPLPGTFRGTLRPYQQRGVDWICWLASVGMGGVLADDMGLGKTIQCLAAMTVRRESAPGGPPCLVVAPTSVIRNWAAEAARFAPGLHVNVYHGSARDLGAPADLVLTTWALLRLDVEALAARAWDVLVLDEAQAAKNPDSQVASAARRIKAALRLAVTGTPVENRLEELWSLFHIVNPGLLGGRNVFRDRFARPIADGHRGAREQLRRRIRPFTLRRMKAEVAADLPPRTDVVLRCTLSEREKEIYHSVASLRRAEVASMLSGGRTLQVLEVLLRMRQAACHPGLLTGKAAPVPIVAPPSVSPPNTSPPSSAKVDLLMEELEEVLDNPGEERHRALVFSQWTSMLDLVEPHLRARNIGFVRLDGSTRDRAGVVAQFNDPNGPEVFLLSLTAGGTGLNLVAADYVFLLDPWWNPAVEQQATDRAHRIGQTRPVVAYRLVAEDTVEERILELQGRKRELAKAALDEGVLANSLAREDILALFD